MPDRYRLSRRLADAGGRHDYALVVELPDGDVIGQAWAPSSIDQMDELVRLANIGAAAEAEEERLTLREAALPTPGTLARSILVDLLDRGASQRSSIDGRVARVAGVDPTAGEVTDALANLVERGLAVCTSDNLWRATGRARELT